ncbi:alpha/beta hydrolase [Annulohypoxylon stygium]|nr:alpha/beta hydrolase [Annulohypoxylon stygium]
MFQFFKSSFFNFEFIRVLGTAPFGGADTAECLDATSRIKNNDPESWFRAWLALAEKSEVLANEALQDGDRAAARDAFLRSSNYYRASQYMFSDLPGNPEPRIERLFGKSVANFRLATQFLDADVKFLSIPYESRQALPGYIYLPTPHNRPPGKIPVLINCGGADSTQEELYSLYPASGVERGYAVLTFDGPGQGIMLRRDRLCMRPDWEIVIKSVLDHLETISTELDLDLDRIAIAGASMGGYYALRGASDTRIAACISIDPIYDMWDIAIDRMPAAFINAWMSGWLSNNFFNITWRVLSFFDFQIHWELSHCMWIFGKPSAALAMKEMQRWTLRGPRDNVPFLSKIKCPVLVSGATGTIYLRPEISTLRVAEDLAHLPEGYKEVWIAHEPGDGGLQAKVGAWKLLQQRTFQFLDRHLDVWRPTLDG